MKEINSPGEFMEMANAFRISRIILSAHELNIFILLKDGPLTSVNVAKTAGTNERATDRLMNALVPIGLLKKSGSQFFNTDFSTRFMIKGQPSYHGWHRPSCPALEDMEHINRSCKSRNIGSL